MDRKLVVEFVLEHGYTEGFNKFSGFNNYPEKDASTWEVLKFRAKVLNAYAEQYLENLNTIPTEDRPDCDWLATNTQRANRALMQCNFNSGCSLEVKRSWDFDFVIKVIKTAEELESLSELTKDRLPLDYSDATNIIIPGFRYAYNAYLNESFDSLK